MVSGECGKEAEAVEKDHKAPDDGADKSPVELVAHHGEPRVFRVVGVLSPQAGQGQG